MFFLKIEILQSMEAVGMLGWQDSTVANLMGKAVEERHSD